MHRRWNKPWFARVALCLAAAVMPCAAGAQGDKTPAPPPEAQQRLADLAERFTESPAAPKAGEARHDTAAPDTADIAVTATPAPPLTGPSTAAPTADPDAKAAPVVAVDTPVEQRPLGSATQPRGGTEGLAPPTGGWTLSTLAALGVVIALIFAARWVYARMGGRVIARSSPAVEVLSRTTVAPKNQVVLLRIGQRVLVVGDSPSGLRTLANLDDPEEVAALLQTVTAAQHDSVSKTFGSLVSRFNGEYDARTMRREEGGDGSEFRVDRTRDSLSGLASRLRTLADRGTAASPVNPRGGPA